MMNENGPISNDSENIDDKSLLDSVSYHNKSFGINKDEETKYEESINQRSGANTTQWTSYSTNSMHIQERFPHDMTGSDNFTAREDTNSSSFLGFLQHSNDSLASDSSNIFENSTPGSLSDSISRVGSYDALAYYPRVASLKASQLDVDSESFTPMGMYGPMSPTLSDNQSIYSSGCVNIDNSSNVGHSFKGQGQFLSPRAYPNQGNPPGILTDLNSNQFQSPMPITKPIGTPIMRKTSPDLGDLVKKENICQSIARSYTSELESKRLNTAELYGLPPEQIPPKASKDKVRATISDTTDGYIYQVRFKRAHRNFILGPYAPRNIQPGMFVKVEADRGEDLGVVLAKIQADQFVENIPTAGYRGRGFSTGCTERKLILRVASPQEKLSIADKLEEEEKVLQVIREKATERNLPMQVLDAEFQFDRHKLTYYFEADKRIDFRDLVSELFSLYKTRIWMQQVDTSTIPADDDPGVRLAQAAGLLPPHSNQYRTMSTQQHFKHHQDARAFSNQSATGSIDSKFSSSMRLSNSVDSNLSSMSTHSKYNAGHSQAYTPSPPYKPPIDTRSYLNRIIHDSVSSFQPSHQGSANLESSYHFNKNAIPTNPTGSGNAGGSNRDNQSEETSYVEGFGPLANNQSKY